MLALPQRPFPNHTGTPNDEVCKRCDSGSGRSHGDNGLWPLHRLRHEVPRGLVVVHDMDVVDQ